MPIKLKAPSKRMVSAPVNSILFSICTNPFFRCPTITAFFSNVLDSFFCSLSKSTKSLSSSLTIAVSGKPAIFIPYPYAIDDHQTANACALTDCGGAVLLRQADMDSPSLASLLQEFQASPQRLTTMAAAAHAAARPDAAKRVSDCCEELMHA